MYVNDQKLYERSINLKMESGKQRLYRFKKNKSDCMWSVFVNNKRLCSKMGFFDRMAESIIDDYFKYESRKYDRLKSVKIIADAMCGIEAILPHGLDGFNMCGIVIGNLCEHAKKRKKKWI